MKRQSRMDQVIKRNRRRAVADILVGGLTHGAILTMAIMLMGL